MEVLKHYIVHLKLTEHYMFIILELKFLKKFEKKKKKLSSICMSKYTG